MDEIKTKMGDGEMASLNTTTLEGSRLTVDELFAACSAIPFFADKRLVIVTGLLERFESRARRVQESRAGTDGSAKGAGWKPFAECLSSLPQTADVVLQDESASSANPLFKALSKSAQVRWFAPLRPSEVSAWIERRIKNSGGSITPGAARLLADSVGNNLWVLASEIEKLLVYRGAGKVAEEDVRLLVSHARDANVFAMVDAIVERRADVALRLMHQLLDQGATPPYLLVMITRQFRQLIQAKELVMQRARPAEIRRILAIASDFVFDKVMKQLGGYSPAQLDEVYHLLLQVDEDSKTGRSDQEVALDLLVLDLCRRPTQVVPGTRTARPALLPR